MEEVVVCPNCGETNPADLPFCQHCQWRLKTLDGAWSKLEAETPLHPEPAGKGYPGDAPLPDWLEALHTQEAQDGSIREKTTESVDDDLLKGLTEKARPDDELPDWVSRIMGISEGDESRDEPRVGDSAQVPQSDTQARPDEGRASVLPSPLGLDSVEPDFRELREDLSPAEGVPGIEPVPSEDSSVFDWLKQLDASTAEAEEQPERSAAPPSPEIPDWVGQMQGISTEDEAAGELEATPDWVMNPRADGAIKATDDTSVSGAPAWMDEDLSQRAAGAAGDLQYTDASTPPTPTNGGKTIVPAFLPEEIRGLDVDALFASMQAPGWLADLQTPEPEAGGESAGGIKEQASISPVALPNWVQAMRPSEPAPLGPGVGEPGANVEEGGPLLGLQGVLPAVPGAGVPTSRPRSKALKLAASELDQKQASLLENLIAGETRPLPLRGTPPAGIGRAFRWAASLLMLAAVGVASFSGSHVLAMPTSMPNETAAAIEAARSLEPSAVVLVVFDYEPSTVGEMEATAAPLLDHMMILRHPRLAVVSTSPTGPALAERMLDGVLKDRGYVRGQTYVNLGYIPGGLIGVQAFAQDPVATMPFGVAAEPVWKSAPLAGTVQLAEFGAIVVITDSLESGRTWIEQTATSRGNVPLILAASAQAGPMLLPYFDSGQVAGLVAGINGAAHVEIANNGLPGLVRQYWDAYSAGLYVATLLIALGTLWHLWRGYRNRPGTS